MSWRPLLCLLAASALALPAEEQERRVHRLIGGHMKIFHEDSHDTESLTASASGSKDKKHQKSDDEDKKTLSQQVADGKYGLIQKELFATPSKRPGVISYESNPDVPKDNINSLGGLTKNEIWLAENHLLVLKGGSYPVHDDKKDHNPPSWPAIDDYKAPLRQVKIPANPKVPPPFPVQLTDDGPLQILGTNSSRTLNGTFDASNFPLPPPGYDPGTGPFFPFPPYPDPSNFTSGQSPFPVPPLPSGEYQPGSPFPPFPLNGTLPPFFASLPPGAAVLPPPNQSEPFDEDDPSIYYPPPYSFYYPKDNSSVVPAGPLVPGIVLPPPPNFFAPLEEKTTRKPTRQRVKTTTTPLPQLHPTTTAVPPTSVLEHKRKPIRILPVHQPAEINNELKPIVTTTPTPEVVTTVPVRHRTQKPQRRPSVTVLKPVKPSRAPPKIYVYNNEVAGTPFKVYGPPLRQKTVISTTQVPLKLYYSTTNDIETNSITQPPEKYHIGVAPRTTTKNPAQYYYYEEQQRPAEVTTSKPNNQNYFDIPKEYYVPAKPSNPEPPTQRPQYIYVTARPQRPQYRFVQQTPKTDSFSLHIARLQKQIHQYLTTPRPFRQQPSPKPVYQFSFEAANYRPQQQQLEEDDQQDRFRPLPRYSVQIQPAVEIVPTQPPQQVYYKQSSTRRPQVYYQQGSTENPQVYYQQGSTESPQVYYQPSSSERPAVYYQQSSTERPGDYYQQSSTERPRNYYQQSSTERSRPSKYYSTSRPDYDYEDVEVKEPQRNAVTSRPVSQYSYDASPNPNYQGYYTKPDEGYFDENTKQYFTSFGQKLPSGTTPIPQLRKPNRYQKPVSLESDTNVNYYKPRPNINPDAEYVQVNQQRVNYPQYAQRPQQYVRQQPAKKQETEIVKAVPVNVPTAEGQPGSFISYQLPGDDGAHFYFLTPQLAQRRDQGSGFFYSQNAPNRIRRNGRNRES